MLGNWFRTGLLMAAIMALFGMVGAVLGGGQGMMLALAFAAPRRATLAHGQPPT